MKKITRTTGLKGTLTVPGDKSISHRAIMFGSLSEGTTTIHGFLKGADCLSTIDCFRKMGISIEEKDETIYLFFLFHFHRIFQHHMQTQCNLLFLFFFLQNRFLL